MKSIDQLSPSDFTTHCVWEFANDMEENQKDETCVQPVDKLPVASLSNRVVGTNLLLANGQSVVAILGNIDLADPLNTEHFLTATIFRHSGERFHLARYHDLDYAQNGPAALAIFLGLPLDSVFPLRYDIGAVAEGNSESLRRLIPANPTSRLSRQQLMELALK